MGFSCVLKTRTLAVPGSGSALSGLMMIGEGPGLNEDRDGLPFVGRAGKLLDKLLSEISINRKDTFSKTIPSKIYNFVLRTISGIKIHDFNCGLKVYRREVVKVVNIYGGLHRFIPIIIKKNGFNHICEVPVNHRKRKFGFSKYGSSRLFHGFFDLITLMFFNKYLNRPMHFFGLFGLIFFLIGFIINVYLTYNWFQGVWINPHKNPLFFLGILLLIIGVQFFSIGLIGELIVRFNKDKDNYIKINE